MPVDTLPPVSPRPNVADVATLAARWGVSTARASQIIHTWIERPGPGVPEVQVLPSTPVVTVADVRLWEEALRDDGQPIPGERPRGPAPRKRNP